MSGASLRAARAMALSLTVNADTGIVVTAAEPEVADSKARCRLDAYFAPSPSMGAAGGTSQ